MQIDLPDLLKFCLVYDNVFILLGTDCSAASHPRNDRPQAVVSPRNPRALSSSLDLRPACHLFRLSPAE
jgi:hypothetical protein